MNDSISFPHQTAQVLYEDYLDITSTSERGSFQKSEQATGPKVTLGMPQEWDLLALSSQQNKVLPSEMILMSQEADFYLVKLAITFHPQKDTLINWAQLTVYLRPEKAGFGVPIAFDLYPKAIIDESKTDVKLGISPEVKFSEISFKLGEVSTLFEHRNFAPIMTGFGLLESRPVWEFQHHKSHPLKGSRESYMIIKKPHDSGAVRITLDATVEGTMANQIFNARRKQSHSTHCSHIFCQGG